MLLIKRFAIDNKCTQKAVNNVLGFSKKTTLNREIKNHIYIYKTSRNNLGIKGSTWNIFKGTFSLHLMRKSSLKIPQFSQILTMKLHNKGARLMCVTLFWCLYC